jgi:hypothetical protein
MLKRKRRVTRLCLPLLKLNMSRDMSGQMIFGFPWIL